jgi:hypothetical protein
MMNCKYILDNEIHEKYLLGRLSEKEELEYKTHIKSCKKCISELNRQRLFISGIREIGKGEMKNEILQQVRERRKKRPAQNWGMIIKVAAAVLFIVIAPGMIYYYQNYAPKTVHKQAVDKVLAPPRAEMESEETPSEIINAPSPTSTTIKRGKIDRDEEVDLGKDHVENLLGTVASGKKEEKIQGPIRAPSRSMAEQTIDGLGESESIEKQKTLKTEKASIPREGKSRLAAKKEPPRSVPSPVAEEADNHSDSQISPKLKLFSYNKGGLESKEIQQEKAINFTLDSLNVFIQFMYEDPFNYSTKKNLPPDTFDVLITNRDVSNFSMVSFVNDYFKDLNEKDIRLDYSQKPIFQIIIKDTIFYQLDLSQDKTQAIQSK